MKRIVSNLLHRIVRDLGDSAFDDSLGKVDFFLAAAVAAVDAGGTYTAFDDKEASTLGGSRVLTHCF